MKTLKFLLPLALLAAATPAFPVSKEIIQLQTQVQALQDQMLRMQQSFDERMGVMRQLVEGTTDKMNQINAGMADLQRTIKQQQSDGGTRVDQLSGQIQALNDSVDELKARMGKIANQLDAMQNAQTTLPAGATPPAGQAQQQQQAPPPDVLYNNALRDYNGAKYDLASQEFADYLKFYPNTDLAGNAQFYIADLAYRQGNYEQAVKEYDKVLEQYPGGNKAPAAQLKKGFALLELGRRNDGMRELNSLIQRYPRSLEADQARKRLASLGSKPSAQRPARRPGE
ncbi:MAG TPA: tol-pal system protein YbgF [Terriglobales bacterium]|jgi:tol-pal system protein YbgF|nr:tol-pal system protein YbgF [Terriglobales bacterium]